MENSLIQCAHTYTHAHLRACRLKNSLLITWTFCRQGSHAQPYCSLSHSTSAHTAGIVSKHKTAIVWVMPAETSITRSWFHKGNTSEIILMKIDSRKWMGINIYFRVLHILQLFLNERQFENIKLCIIKVIACNKTQFIFFVQENPQQNLREGVRWNFIMQKHSPAWFSWNVNNAPLLH